MASDDIPRQPDAAAVEGPGPQTDTPAEETPQATNTLVEAAQQATANVTAAAAQAGANVAAATAQVAQVAQQATANVTAATVQATAQVAQVAQQAGANVGAATVQATKQVVQATQTAQATLQQAGQRATVSPRKAVYRGRRFAVGFALGTMMLTFMAAMARRYKILPGDVGMARMLQKPNFKPYDLMMQLISELGWQIPSLITRTTFSTVMWAAGFRMEGVATAGTMSGDLVTMIVKGMVNRPRPTPDLVRRTHNLGETSFPSGHVVHYVTFYGFLFYLFFTHLKNGRGRNAVLTLLAMVVLLVGPSRVYMGAHWPSDVAAAYVVGSLWLSVEIIAYLEMKSRFQILTGWPFLAKRSTRIE